MIYTSWLTSCQTTNKIEILKKRALDDNPLCYRYSLEKPGKVEITVSRLRILCIEIYKTINNLNPIFMNNIFGAKIPQRLPKDKYKLNTDISI